MDRPPTELTLRRARQAGGGGAAEALEDKAMTSPSLALAWSHYQSGNFAEAARLYRHVLTGEPGNADLWCMLGVACRAGGQLQEAAESYREALRLRPGFVEALNNLANVLVTQGQYEEAAARYREILTVRPDMAQTHNNLGVALRYLKRWQEAMQSYREALRLKPDFADAHNNLGDALASLQRVDEAMASYRQAIRLKPDYPEAHNNLGVALAKLERPADAIAAYHEALRLRPRYAEAQLNLGNVYWSLHRFEEAQQAYRQALDVKPDYSDALAGLGNALVELERPEEALACYNRALELKPSEAEIFDNRAQSYLALGKPDEALEDFDRAIAARPDSGKSHMGRALTWLMQGRYAAGWAEYEWRWQCREFKPLDFPQPRWNGEPLQGRTILLRAEQGLGDTIHFARFAPLVQARGGRVLLACQKPLLALLKSCPGVDQLAACDEPLPEFHVYASLLSLPHLLGTTLDTIPAPIPYLAAEPALVEAWRARLGAIPGFKIGICWQGNPQQPADRHRSFPLALFAPLARMPGVRLISLQKGHGTEQIAALPEPFPLVDFGQELDAAGPFLDTAAVIASLDLVITADTSIAHLAGALGAPVWIALGRSPEWRWLWDREESPWYPTARLFRQQRSGDWAGVFRRMAEALDARLKAMSASSPIRVEVSAGELIDKITILQIKAARFTTAEKLQNVRRELEHLLSVRQSALPSSAELDRLVEELRGINESLWRIEDDIRLCERDGDFGPRFIELARAVYRTNDRRSEVKRAINALAGSRMVEEKGYAAYY